MKSRIKLSDGQIVEGEVIPYAPLQEPFNFYQPNVPEGHPLHGCTIKLKAVVKQILYTGNDELGNPRIMCSWEGVIALE